VVDVIIVTVVVDVVGVDGDVYIVVCGCGVEYVIAPMVLIRW
jgi:hypothetical protein